MAHRSVASSSKLSNAQRLPSFERALWGVFHVLDEKDAGGEAPSHIIERGLLLFDFVHLLTFVMHHSLGWPHEYTALHISPLSLLFPNPSFEIIAGLIAVSIFLVVASVGNAVYVGFILVNVQAGERFALWPVKTLKLLVKTLITAGYIVVVGMLILPLRCEPLLEMIGEHGFTCMSPSHLIIATFSGLALCVFVPFCLIAAAVFFDPCPSSQELLASPHGRLMFVDTLVRTVIIALVEMIGDSTLLIAVAVSLMLLLLLFLCATWLPYYSMPINCLRCSMYGIAAWLSLAGSIPLMVIAGENAEHTTQMLIGLIALVTAPFAAVGAWYLPLLQRNRLRKRLKSLLAFIAAPDGAKLVEHARRYSITGQVGKASAELETTATKPKGKKKVMDAFDVLDIIEGALEEPTPSAATPPKRATLDFGDPKVQRLITLIQSPYEAELLVRIYLCDNSFPVQSNPRRLRPTRQAVSQADSIYHYAIQMMPHSAYIPTQYSEFVAEYEDDANRAFAMLQGVWSLRPAFDIRFALTSKERSLEQRRQGQNLGLENMDSIGALAYRQTYAKAMKHHARVLKLISELWGSIGNGSDDGTIIPQRIHAITAARDIAGGAYVQLRKQCPSAVDIMYSYADFLEFVIQDNEAADKLRKEASDRNAAMTDDKENVHGEPEGTGDMHSAKAGGSVGGSTAKRSQTYLARQEVRAKATASSVKRVKKMAMGLSFLLVVVAALVIASYAMARSNMNQLSHDMQGLVQLRSTRTQVADSLLKARGIMLAATSGNTSAILNARSHMLSLMQSYDASTHTLFLDRSLTLSSAVKTLMTRARVTTITSFAVNGHLQTNEFSRTLWDAAQMLKVYACQLARLPLSDLSPQKIAMDTSWRFVFDNCLQHLLPAFVTLVTTFTEGFVTSASDISTRQWGFLAAIFFSILVQLIFFASRARLTIAETRAQAASIASKLPSNQVRTLARRFQRMEDALHRRAMKLAENDGSDTEDEDDDQEDGDNGTMLPSGAGAYAATPGVLSASLSVEDDGDEPTGSVVIQAPAIDVTQLGVRSRRFVSDEDRSVGHHSRTTEKRTSASAVTPANNHSSTVSLFVQVAFAMAVIAALQVVVFVRSGAAVNVASSFAHEMDEAGRQRMAETLTAALSLEAFIGDGQLSGFSQAQLLQSVADYSDLIRKIHDGLKYGSAELQLPGSIGRYKPQDDLLTGSDPSSFNAADRSVNNAAAHGLDALLGVYLDAVTSNRIALERRGYGYGTNLTAIAASTDLSFILNIDSTLLRGLLTKSMEFYMDEYSIIVTQASLESAIFFVINLVTIAALYLFVYQRLFVALIRDAKVASEFISLIPAAWLTTDKLLCDALFGRKQDVTEAKQEDKVNGRQSSW